MARVHADHRQVERTELVPEPDGQRPRLHADAYRVRCPSAHERGDGVGFPHRHALRQRPAFLVDHADRGRLLRNIEPHVALHRPLPLRLPRPSSQRGGITLSGVKAPVLGLVRGLVGRPRRSTEGVRYRRGGRRFLISDSAGRPTIRGSARARGHRRSRTCTLAEMSAREDVGPMVQMADVTAAIGCGSIRSGAAVERRSRKTRKRRLGFSRPRRGVREHARPRGRRRRPVGPARRGPDSGGLRW